MENENINLEQQAPEGTVNVGTPIEIPVPNDTFVFTIQNEEYIKLTREGFFYKGNLVTEDKEIYDKFKTWLDTAIEERNKK